MKTKSRFYIRFLLFAAAAAISASEVQTSSAQPYPPMLLQVPFQCQYPPGTASETKNCGQSCALMAGAYFKRYTPSSTQITDANTWLATTLKDSRYKDANGYYTHFNDGRNSLGRLLREYHGLNYSVLYGGNFTSILYQLNMGRPVIVGVKISAGSIVSTGGVAHWALAVGYDPIRHELILNDPGTKSGKFKRLIMADFDASWATQGRIYAPIWK